MMALHTCCLFFPILFFKNFTFFFYYREGNNIKNPSRKMYKGNYENLEI